MELAALRPSLGTYFVLSNHDYMGCGQSREALGRAAFRDITNRSIQVRENVHFIGLDECSYGKPDVATAFAGTDRGARMVFAHNPQIFRTVRDRACVLICGLTHGGQVAVPILTPMVARTVEHDHQGGWFAEASSLLYVNRGIGTLGLPLRFRCRPEITVLDLVAPDEQADSPPVVRA